MSRRPLTLPLVSLLAVLPILGCSDTPMGMELDMSPPPVEEKTAVSDLPLGITLRDPKLTGAVDLVRDEWGIPHIYGRSMPDVAFAQGWVMAADRFVQMDLARHQADGSLAELLGVLSPSLIDTDIRYRLHHMRKTAEKTWAELSGSADPTDQKLTKIMESFAAGVNMYLNALKKGDYQLPVALGFVYQPANTKPWTPVDSMLLGVLQAFQLSFDASSEIERSLMEAKDAAAFGMAKDPQLKARSGISKDLSIFAPFDPTYTIDGWTGMNGDTSRAALPAAGPDALALLEAAAPSVKGIGADRAVNPARGSNNWIVGPQLSETGHVLVANDTHLDLGNPATFYLSHLSATGESKPVNVMGVQFPGIPGVILGMNDHVAWGATTNYLDVTDVYQETVVACDGGGPTPCVMWKGNKVPLVPRKETIGIGKYGQIASTLEITYYDVPHHGPIIPRIMGNHQLEALGSQEMSIRYTGYDGGQLFRAIYGLDAASTMKEAVDSLDRDFTFGGQNWVIGDDAGNFGWTQYVRVPRRSRAAAPWKVMPGDGTAEWGPDMDPRYIPHSYNPGKNYLATANADPIGVTDDGDPWNEPTVDGTPLYLAADYDAGTRVGRIVKRIEAVRKGGKKISLDEMQSIQADAVSEWGQAFAPVLTDAAVALTDEAKKPGTHPELAAIVAGASPFALAAIENLTTIVPNWSFDTPSGLDEEKPTAAQVRDSLVTTVVSAFQGRFIARALGDELASLGEQPSSAFVFKLIARMCTAPDKLQTGVSKMTGDAVLFDDLATPRVEGKREIAAAALVDAVQFLAQTLGMDATQWRWGRLHGLTLEFPAGIDALNVPTSKEMAGGFPRHGAVGTVDVASFGLSTMSFNYSEGPAIRFVCDLDPKGPRARNALPGGEVFDPASSHYRDQMEQWRANKTFDLAFSVADVRASATREAAARKAIADMGKDDSNHPAGRIRFVMGSN